ncbi:MAG: cobalamin-binding protein, partial [Myxococcaceae bacterium]
MTAPLASSGVLDLPDGEAPSLPGLSRTYLHALLRGDRAGALAVVMGQGLERGVSVPELQIGVIQPAQREVGALWERNEISVVQEHLATSISQLVVAHLYPHLPRGASNGKRVIVACVEGELHELGARMGADFFEMAGFDVTLVGPGCPVGRLVERVASERADLLGLSATL